jgi:MFS transporter, DHA2 family, multidrug resistance protein
VHELTGTLATQGGSTAASQQAYGAIYGTLVRQASLMSYIDNFRLLSFLCVLCVPTVFLFARVKRKSPVPMH